MKHLDVGFTLALLCSLVACRANPQPDVKPMAASPANVTDISEAVIPLDQVSKSQAAAVGQRVATTEITVTYSRPVARGRQIFGALVPYGQVWTPGADQATAITFTRDVQINGHALPKGSYSIWTVPRADNWTVTSTRRQRRTTTITRANRRMPFDWTFGRNRDRTSTPSRFRFRSSKAKMPCFVWNGRTSGCRSRCEFRERRGRVYFVAGRAVGCARIGLSPTVHDSGSDTGS